MSEAFILVKDGIAATSLLVPYNCAIQIKKAATELCRSIQLISGARLPIVEFDPKERPNGKIILSEFSSLPYAKTQFSEDYDALMGTDGFSVRYFNNNVYIISHCSSGVFFGAHDFIENAADIVWTRGDGENGCSFIASKNIAAAQFDYFSKSPFVVRGWNTCGKGAQGDKLDYDTMLTFAKNKINAKFGVYSSDYFDLGINPFGVHVGSIHLLDEYADRFPTAFMTGFDSKPKRAVHESYINYYSKQAAELFADKIIGFLKDNPLYAEITLNLGIPDDPYFYMEDNGVVLSELPFTTDDGNTVYPADLNYKSTVYYNYLYRVLDIVGRQFEQARFVTLAYLYALPAPNTIIHKNLSVAIAPILTNDHTDYLSDSSTVTANIRTNILNWLKLTSDVYVYNYWQCYRGDIYSRPNVYTVQKVLKWYRDIGVKGLVPEGKIDSAAVNGKDALFDMNEMYYWQTNRLFYNPDEDLESLTERFCRIVYGEAADDMRKYYSLIQKGWDGNDAYVFYATGFDVYIGQFMIKSGIADDAVDALNKALTKKLNTKQRGKIEAIYNVVKAQLELNKLRGTEDASARFCSVGADTILSDKMLAVEENSDSVWKKAGTISVFKNYDTFSDYDPETKFNVKMLWDDEYIYFGFQVFDDMLADTPIMFNRFNQPIYERIDKSKVESYTETYIGGNILNMSEYFGYITGIFYDRNAACYSNKGIPQSIEMPSGFKESFCRHVDKDCSKSYYFHVQAIAFKDLCVTSQTARVYGSFVYYSDRYGRVGWKGNGLWCKQNFSEIILEK